MWAPSHGLVSGLIARSTITYTRDNRRAPCRALPRPSTISSRARHSGVSNRDADVETIQCLLAEQFPHWSGMPLARIEPGGWDNTTFRLGDELAVRLPNHDALVEQVAKEHRWLPVLADALPLAIPTPVGFGHPGCGFERPWSITRWLDGTTVGATTPLDHETVAEQLAEFLTALHRVPVAGGPEPGVHSYHRGGPLALFDQRARDAIRQLDGIIDAAGAQAVWNTAIASEWDRTPVWVHGDMTGSNLLSSDGRLAAVIDFGCCAVGDPACDLGIAWTLLDPPARRHLARSLHLDDGCWYRAKGWVLWKALRGLVTQPADHPRNTGERLGWRWTSLEVIEALAASNDP